MVTVRIGAAQEELSWEQWEDRVREGRIPETAMIRFDPVTGDTFVQASTLDSFQSLRSDALRAWSDSFRAGQPPWMTALIAGAQIRLWWLLITAGNDLQRIPEALLLSHAKVLEDGEVWRLFSMGILHLAPLHIGANLAMLVYVGWSLERALGRLNLLTIFVGSVLGGSILSILAKPGVTSLGASGGVLGIVAAATVFGFIRSQLMTDRARVVFGWALFPYLALVYLSGWTNESTDNWAHTGGLITGAVLALLLDPPGLERRPRWGTLAPVVAFLSMGVITATLYAAGPSLISVQDIGARVPATSSKRPYRELEWSAPTGWVRGTVRSRSGFVSKGSHQRGFSARQTDLGGYTRADTAIDELRRTLEKEHGSSFETLEVTPTVVAGIEGLELRYRIGGPSPVRVSHRIVTRGMQALETVWSVEEGLQGRLAGIHERCQESIRWNEPLALVEARADVARRPKSRAARRQLATALDLVGSSEDAREIWNALVDEHPELPDGWAGLLTHHGRLHSYTLPPRDLWERALAVSAAPATQVEVALSMHAHGELALAIGLLELAWAHAPGDRQVRRARRPMGLPVRLTTESIPWQRVVDPMTGQPLPPRDLQRPPAISIENAQLVGRRWIEVRDALEDEVMRAEDPTSAGALLLLRYGLLPEDSELETALRTTFDDLALTARGAEITWVSPRLTKWAQAQWEANPQWGDDVASLASEPVDLEALGLRSIPGPEGPMLVRTVDRATRAP